MHESPLWENTLGIPLLSKILRYHFQQPQTRLLLSHTTNTPCLPFSLALPPVLLAESPPAGRCTLRWQPKCQPALHMPASAVPAYSCHSPPGFSWPALPKSVPTPQHSPSLTASTPRHSSNTHTHTPNLLLSRTKTWSTFGSLLAFTCLIFPCASSSPFSPFLTLHSALLWPSSALLPPPERPLVVALFFETSLDIMPRDRSRHSQNKKPGHINQRRSVWRPRVRSMHHPSTGCTLGFIGETSVVGRVLLLASYSGLYWAQGTDAWCECLKRSMFICLHSLRTAHITLSDRSACSVFPQDAKQPPYPLTPSNQINTSQRINTQTECPKNWMWEDELYHPPPLLCCRQKEKKGIISQTHIVQPHGQTTAQCVRFIPSYSCCAIYFVDPVRLL